MRRLLLSILLLALPFIANAETAQIEGIWYEMIADIKEAKVIKDPNTSLINGNYNGDVVIPEKISFNGVEYSVTSIGENAFASCFKLTSIAIPKFLTNIGAGAFHNCYNLKNITIPNTVTSIGNSVFAGCSSLSNIIIPNSVTSIGNEAFFACTSLSSITIPNSVTSIGYSAFQSCLNLTSVTIPSTVTNIGNSAFFQCTSLTNITIPHLVTSISECMFSYCTNLVSVTIPNSVTSIGNSAFSGCSNLTNITIPNLVKNIGYETFYRCYKLTEVYCLAEQVPSIDNTAFKETPIANAILYVPANALDDYNATTSWNGFGTIVALTNEDILKTNSEQIMPILVQAHDERITIQGVKSGIAISIYTIDGTEVASCIAAQQGVVHTFDTNLQNGDIAIVKIGSKSVKVVMK